MRILFFGDGAWATESLQRLIEEQHTILGVIVRSKPSDPNLMALAEENKLQLHQPAKVNAPAFVQQLAKTKPELNISVSYDQIIHRPLLDLAPKGFVNLHGGKLPNYRGRTVVNWAILNGETEIGLTAHYMDEGIDTGDIILQRTLPIHWTDTYGEVLQRLVQECPSLISETVRLIANGSAPRQVQRHLQGTYFAARGPGDEWLDWSDTSHRLYNKVRAITRPAPGARTRHNNQDVTIWKATYDPSWPKYLATPGQVVGSKNNEGVFVKTGDSTLLITETQVGSEPPKVPNWPIGTRFKSPPS
jgi:methionyl-tRNA formyltransferase